MMSRELWQPLLFSFFYFFFFLLFSGKETSVGRIMTPIIEKKESRLRTLRKISLHITNKALPIGKQKFWNY